MKRRVLVWVLAGVLALGGTACGGNNNSSSSSDASGGSAGTDGGAGAGAGGTGTAGASGAGGAAGSAGAGGSGPLLAGPCDPLVPGYCSFPFPSNVWLKSDPGTPTGKRVDLDAASLPVSANGTHTTPAPFDQSDGFSASEALLTVMPGATTTGLPTPVTIAHSLDIDSPTVIIDADTGEHIAHFSELDVAAAQKPDQQAFMIRPVVRLEDGHRYIVAIRNVLDAQGNPLPPSPAFKALRDGTPSTDPSVKNRRALYNDIFTRLEKAGVPRNNLQLAWDFTTASRENNTGRLLQMRDEALAQVGPDGPSYTIDSVENNVDANIAVRIEGKMTVPLYLDKPGPGASMMLDAQGHPVQNGTAQIPFLFLLPKSATPQNPATVMWYGHGLLGDRYEADSYRDLANLYNYAIIATDWSGMASDDQQNVVSIISGGDIGAFHTVVDRLQQGILDALLATRMAGGKLAQDPSLQLNGQPLVSSTDKVYFGGSQGGILGATYMALSTDVTRGVLAVPGQSYNLMLQRSVDFTQFFGLMNITYKSPLDIQMALDLAQMLWDRAEPSGYSHYIQTNMLPNTPSHSVLMLVAIGDHQVTTLAAHLLARSIGAKNLKPVNRTIWGIPEVDAPYKGSAMIEYDFGLPPEPITNVPMTAGQDPHAEIRTVPSAGQTLNDFLRTGVAEANCSGPCNPD